MTKALPLTPETSQQPQSPTVFEDVPAEGQEEGQEASSYRTPSPRNPHNLPSTTPSHFHIDDERSSLRFSLSSQDPYLHNPRQLPPPSNHPQPHHDASHQEPHQPPPRSRPQQQHDALTTGIGAQLNDLNHRARCLRQEANKAASEAASIAESHDDDGNIDLAHAARQLDACILVTSRLASAHAHALRGDQCGLTYPSDWPPNAEASNSSQHLTRNFGISAYPETANASCQADESSTIPHENSKTMLTERNALALIARHSSSSDEHMSSDEENQQMLQLTDSECREPQTEELIYEGPLGHVQMCGPVARLCVRGNVRECGFQRLGSSLDQSTICSLDSYPCARFWAAKSQSQGLYDSISAMSDKLPDTTVATISRTGLFAATHDGMLLRLSIQRQVACVEAQVELPPGAMSAISVCEQSSYGSQIALGDTNGHLHIFGSDASGLYRLCTFTVPQASDVRAVKLLAPADGSKAPTVATASDAGVHTFKLGPLKRPHHYTSEPSNAIDGNFDESLYALSYVS